ncbi:MAG: hypothetical protein HY906_00280 [Deltaproteobacteria bacterium]|nr:hypothetical protein [Deltaproteobacteria bacterium]
MRLGPIVVAVAALVAPGLLAAAPPAPRAALEAKCGVGGPKSAARAKHFFEKACKAGLAEGCEAVK